MLEVKSPMLVRGPMSFILENYLSMLIWLEVWGLTLDHEGVGGHVEDIRGRRIHVGHTGDGIPHIGSS